MVSCLETWSLFGRSQQGCPRRGNSPGEGPEWRKPPGRPGVGKGLEAGETEGQYFFQAKGGASGDKGVFLGPGVGVHIHPWGLKGSSIQCQVKMGAGLLYAPVSPRKMNTSPICATNHEGVPLAPQTSGVECERGAGIGLPGQAECREQRWRALKHIPLPWAPHINSLASLQSPPPTGPQETPGMLFCSWRSDMGNGRSLGHKVMFPQNRGHCHLQSPTFPLKANNCQEFWDC